jgi:hypothetical protein
LVPEINSEAARAAQGNEVASSARIEERLILGQRHRVDWQ